MRIGFVLRTMGPASAPATVAALARAVDAEPAIADLWVPDHIAIPPDDAEGSGGRYLDPLATLAFVAGCTTRVGLGTGVLVLPYRPPLPTAKWVATIQELSGGRLLLGVGVGWMAAEFRVVGVPLARRGRTSDETLEYLNRCFAADVMEANGQPFYFLPRPPRPPLFIGGAPPHAFRRALQYGAGWMPIGLDPDALRPLAQELRDAATRAGKPAPDVALMTRLPLADTARARDVIARFAEAGATHLVHGGAYDDEAGGRQAIDALARAARI